MKRTVCVFAGARGPSELHETIKEVGTELASQGCEVLYGGSAKGIMGALARGVAEAGSKAIGVLPERIAALKHHSDLTETVVVKDMPSRKEIFWQSDAYLCLPGGLGTMDELFEIWALTKLGYSHSSKPIVVLNLDGYYDYLIHFLERMVTDGYLTRERRDMVKFVTDPLEAVSLVSGGV